MSMVTYSSDPTTLTPIQRKEYEFNNTFYSENSLDARIKQMFRNSTSRYSSIRIEQR